MHPLRASITTGLAAAILVTVAPPQSVGAQVLDSATLAGFRWRTVGPANFGGRVADVAGIPSPSRTFFVAAAGGGIWKTTNAGTTFRPVFDNERVVAMGALAIAPSDTNQVWAGTGEQNSRNTIEPGMGIYKSTDGGLRWKLMGLEKTQHIGRIVVHPTNPNIVYVAAVGAAWKANAERGLYKTTDGGATWKLVKFVDDSTGFIDVAMDPSDPNVLYASSYQRLRGPYFLRSGGKGSALWKTTDGGETWTEIKGGGFPETTKGRIGIAISRSNPNIVYTLVEADTLPNAKPVKGVAKQKTKSGLYRSEDGGKTWSFMNDQDTRPFYYSQVRVDPKNPNRVYWSSTPVLFSDDGGKTARTATQGIHVDHHAMWIDPNDAEHFIVGDDGGVSQTWDKGGNYDFLNVLPIGQFYDVSYDMAIPYNVCAGAQDNGSWCGPSRRKSGPVTNAYWFTIAGGDGFYTAQDPTDPNIVYGESQGGNISRTNLGTGEVKRLVPPAWRPRYRDIEDSILVLRGDTAQPAPKSVQKQIEELRKVQKSDSIALDMRFNWETPYFLSPHNPQVMYVGGNRVLKSTARGDNLYPISPDLSKQDWKKINISMNTTGGITTDATGAETYGTVVSLAESYVKPGLLYAGTDDGNVWMTANDGGSWTQIPASRFPGLAGDEVYVSRIEPSHFDTLTFFVAFDNHRNNDFTPYLYVTTDGGKSFRSLVNDLPRGGPDQVHVVREDPFNRDVLYAGTSVAAYLSTDRGAHWQRFMTGMPTVPVFDLQVHPRDRELIAATHGRGLFIVDVAPLEQMAGKQIAEFTLFKPKTAYGYGQAPAMGQGSNGEGQKVFAAPSPAYGALISYRVPGTASVGPVKMVVTDANGDTISTINGSGAPGLHSVTWNLRGSRRPTTIAALTRSEVRDSVVFSRRMQTVFDSLGKAGWNPMLLNGVKSMLTGQSDMSSMFAAMMGGGSGSATFQARPGEGAVQRSQGAGAVTAQAGAPAAQSAGAAKPAAAAQPAVAAGAAPAAGTPSAGAAAGAGASGFQFSMSDFNQLQEISTLLGLSRGARFQPVPWLNRNKQNFSASTGDYMVTTTVGGKTYKQVLRVERISGDDNPGSPFEEK
ncbi:MAG TPA: hypothetical protein VF159_12055 [Gemmatimonadaceae bacterium]